MNPFTIDLTGVRIPVQDGEVNEFVNREAASSQMNFSVNRKVIFINGMGNSGPDHATSALALSLVQMCPVIGVYNQSSGFVSDLWQCLADKNQFQGLSASAQNQVNSRNSFWNWIVRGNRTPEHVMLESLSRNPAQISLFRLLRRSENHRREVFAHSQGNLILSNVLQAIAAVDGPQSLNGRVVHTFGSPAVFYPSEIQKFEHGYTFDPVNWLSGFDATFSISKVGMPSGSRNPITHSFMCYLRDDPRFIINRFRTGGLGVTFNMDEAGLAKCLVAMEGNLSRVTAVIDFLDRNQNSDADDVSLLYVQSVKRIPRIVSALKGDPKLVKLLIKTMAEGWTSSQESDAIQWLKSL